MQNIADISPLIFRAYDIRGIYGSTLSDNTADLIGKALARIFASNGVTKVAIGMDGRISSPALKNALSNALIKSGIDVIFIGLVPTPCLYFAVHKLELLGGIMVTGSHNPKDHNGFKIMFRNRSFFGDDIKEIYQTILRNDFITNAVSGQYSECDISEDYINEVTSCIQPNANICIDCGNGASGEIIERIANKIGIPRENLLYTKIDGTFPNHHPDPTVEKNMEDLSHTVIKNSARFGIGLDGDGDRIGIVDEKGRFVYSDKLMCILAKYLLRDVPGATIIGDVKSSKVLFDTIKAHGGKAIMWNTGHSFIKAKMQDEGAELAGEMSGHIFYKNRYYGYDDGIYAGMRLLEIAQRHKVSISSELDALPQTYTSPQLEFTVEDASKFRIMEQIKDFVISRFRDYSTIDGIRVEVENGWFLIRPSNTQNHIIARCEAKDEIELRKLIDEINMVMDCCNK